MKKTFFYFQWLFLLTAFLSVAGCRRNSNDVWEDTKTAGRHVNRGFRSLGGKHGDSRAVRSREDFYPSQAQTEYASNSGNGYIPLPDYENPTDVAMADIVAPQPKDTPGDPGSPIPGIDSFSDPSLDPRLAPIFRNITFEYNSNLVKGDDNLQIVQNISDYMRSHPNVYVFVEGHCDERGPEAYNLSLGSRRGNAVRNTLISSGVSPDNIFTISYGKERPLVLEHHEEAWQKNRRAEFKIYQQ